MCGSPQSLPRVPSCDGHGVAAQRRPLPPPSPSHTSSPHFQPLKHSKSGTLTRPPWRRGPNGDTVSATRGPPMTSVNTTSCASATLVRSYCQKKASCFGPICLLLGLRGRTETLSQAHRCLLTALYPLPQGHFSIPRGC